MHSYNATAFRNIADNKLVNVDVNIDEIEKCTVIKYLFLKGMSCKEICDDMFDTLGDDILSYVVVKT